ncbi:hypothetical protein JAAARDRAFT_256799 [Jaapia argillacea MUCL 33604]|uniref:Secreted protein n=1 Tax=Jaapia argillacea MUCL 33604 TaxID=933084 RepID=A0A067PW47_9AGAM|nr:hypothetical protein JAAARDRAFT_256799 [Jaapia argillacea MUCL 33604]
MKHTTILALPSLLCHALEGGGVLTGGRGLRTGYLSSQETEIHGRADRNGRRVWILPSCIQLSGACMSSAMSMFFFSWPCSLFRVNAMNVIVDSGLTI